MCQVEYKNVQFKNVEFLIVSSWLVGNRKLNQDNIFLGTVVRSSRSTEEHPIETVATENQKVDPKPKATIYGATKLNNYHLVKFLIAQGDDINEKSENQTSLHLAYKKKHLEIFHLLILKGAYLEAKDATGQTVLQIAVGAKQTKKINLLLFNGALGKELFSKEYFFDCCYTDLHFASEHGHLENVKFLVEKGADISAKDGDEKTALHLASENGHFNPAQCLLENGADSKVKSKFEKTALHLAAEKGHFETVQILLENGADIQDTDIFEKTALHFASERGHFETVQSLLEMGAKINVTDIFDKTPLHMASERGHLKIVQILLDKNANFLAKDIVEKTALNFASEKGHDEVVESLIRKGAHINTFDSAGNGHNGEGLLKCNFKQCHKADNIFLDCNEK
jgi:ankyrin repeat protein